MEENDNKKIKENFDSNCYSSNDSFSGKYENEERLKNQIAQERTIFVVVIILIFDSFLFLHLKEAFSSISILFVEFILMCLIGKLFNNEFFSNLTDKIFDALKKRF